MSEKSKRIFLAICLLVPFILYSGYYYAGMINNAPFRFSDFESIEIRWGYPDEMVNYYNSKTHEYRYLNKDDSLVSKSLKMRKDDLQYLHSKAQTIGFFNVDEDMTAGDEVQAPNPKPRYELTYTYKKKRKKVTFDPDFPGHPKMKEAAQTTIEEVQKMIAEAESR